MSRLRSATLWAIRYGLPGMAVRAAARRGDLIARLTADEALREDPFDAYDQLRARGPVVTNRFLSATATHRTASEVLRSDKFVASAGAGPNRLLDRVLTAAVDPKALGPVDPPSLLVVQPPQHTRLRKLVSRTFTPRAVNHLTGRMREVADDLLDRIPEGEPFDLVEAYAAPLPVMVISEILGVPTTMQDEFLRWGNEAAATLDPGLRWRAFWRADAALRDLNAWFENHLAHLRRDPGDDLLSKLVHDGVDNGDRLTDTELRATGLLLLGAGFETTVNLIGNAVRLLLDHPEQLAALRADPSGWANAVEEVLRYDSPVQVTLRVASEDIDLAGQRLPQGRAVITMLGGANRDPAVFSDPHTFDITRPNAREHLAFSAGIHYCLGAQLARLEASIALQALFERFDGLSLAGSPTRRGTRVLRGYTELPLRTNKKAASAATKGT
ncbi:cytochrome P450 [Amycolatopsis sp. CA-230715]|uniref:cytochrome P450 n=1 Tax=Amycolatopsis sp. CA-230715 TaxID=2745196 RepID=UPI001C03751A|nr:cytochrome P450 [Amycolatopsis sp. CA-230715]QWF77818.1 Putative cytochrome P450 140 [Amycolatopsis sp. CA-230715]